MNIEELKQLDFSDDKQLIKVIKDTNSDLFSGKDVDGNEYKGEDIKNCK